MPIIGTNESLYDFKGKIPPFKNKYQPAIPTERRSNMEDNLNAQRDMAGWVKVAK